MRSEHESPVTPKINRDYTRSHSRCAEANYDNTSITFWKNLWLVFVQLVQRTVHKVNGDCHSFRVIFLTSHRGKMSHQMGPIRNRYKTTLVL